jgi:hypothetical protein
VDSPRSAPLAQVPRWRARVPGLVAATIIGLHAAVCAVLAVLFPLAASRDAALSTTSHLMFSVCTVLFAAGLAFVARGLWQGLGWARRATLVWLAVLLPVGWTVVQAGAVLVGAVILGSAVVGIVAAAADSKAAG